MGVAVGGFARGLLWLWVWPVEMAVVVGACQGLGAYPNRARVRATVGRDTWLVANRSLRMYEASILACPEVVGGRAPFCVVARPLMPKKLRMRTCLGRSRRIRPRIVICAHTQADPCSYIHQPPEFSRRVCDRARAAQHVTSGPSRREAGTAGVVALIHSTRKRGLRVW